MTTYDSSTNTWLKNTNYFNATNGIQLWTVPVTGNYQITVAGAQGAPGTATSGGLGAVMQGIFALTQGDKYQILVGQTAPTNAARVGMSSAGGGGSFVVRNGGTTVADILIIAGGGGGTSTIARNANSNAVADSTTARSSSSGAAGGINGGAGSSGWSSSGAGGGFLTGSTSNENGAAFISGGNGGTASPTYSTSGGGFGGGGSVIQGSLTRYAGGGGFSGGGSSNTGADSLATDTGYGGGGSSYNIGTNQSNSVGNLGSGYVRIELYLAPTTLSVSTSSNFVYGLVSTLTANTNVEGRVTFFARGKRIPNCINVRTSSLVATCNYKVASHNYVELTATFTPNDGSYKTAWAATIQAKPIPRTNKR